MGHANPPRMHWPWGLRNSCTGLQTQHLGAQAAVSPLATALLVPCVPTGERTVPTVPSGRPRHGALGCGFALWPWFLPRLWVSVNCPRFPGEAPVSSRLTAERGAE